MGDTCPFEKIKIKKQSEMWVKQDNGNLVDIIFYFQTNNNVKVFKY